jgi:DNA-binding IclR family transcriptional regulator
LLKALEGGAGMSISALAKAAAANRATIRDCLHELATRGTVEKGKAKAREVRPTPPPSS